MSFQDRSKSRPANGRTRIDVPIEKQDHPSPENTNTHALAPEVLFAFQTHCNRPSTAFRQEQPSTAELLNTPFRCNLAQRMQRPLRSRQMPTLQLEPTFHTPLRHCQTVRLCPYV